MAATKSPPLPFSIPVIVVLSVMAGVVVALATTPLKPLSVITETCSTVPPPPPPASAHVNTEPSHFKNLLGVFGAVIWSTTLFALLNNILLILVVEGYVAVVHDGCADVPLLVSIAPTVALLLIVVGGLPAPPPIISSYWSNVPEEAHVVVFEKYTTPPEFPETERTGAVADPEFTISPCVPKPKLVTAEFQEYPPAVV